MFFEWQNNKVPCFGPHCSCWLIYIKKTCFMGVIYGICYPRAICARISVVKLNAIMSFRPKWPPQTVVINSVRWFVLGRWNSRSILIVPRFGTPEVKVSRTCKKEEKILSDLARTTGPQTTKTRHCCSRATWRKSSCVTYRSSIFPRQKPSAIQCSFSRFPNSFEPVVMTISMSTTITAASV